MKSHAFSFDHPEQRLSRTCFRIQEQERSSLGDDTVIVAKWTLKQVQGDEA
jgi:hypothetical protein|tara:strand:+ start:516 stop:668 length:153 start_codon:yes stop_codon:yes gene_type:complete